MKKYLKISQKSYYLTQRIPRKKLIRSNKIYHFNCTTALDAYCYGLKTNDLSDESFTILNDLKLTDDFSSLWLTYPPKIDILEEDLNTYSKRPRQVLCLNFSYFFLPIIRADL